MKPVAVYDVAAAPLTFDFVKFLAAARIYFIVNRGEAEFNVVILCDKFRNWSVREQSMPLYERRWRLHNLLLPIMQLASDIKSFCLTFDRHEVSELQNVLVYPPGYDAWDPRIPYLDDTVNNFFKKTKVPPQLFEAPEQARVYARKILGDVASPIVLSIRNAIFDADRNTDQSLIQKVIAVLVQGGHQVFAIPDQEGDKSAEWGNNGVRLVPEASHSLALRLALHEQSALTIIPSCGLLGVLYLAKKMSPMIVFNPVTPGHAVASADTFRSLGFNVGEKRALDWAPENQHWIWEERPALEDLLPSIKELLP